MNDSEVLNKLLRQQVELLAEKSKDCPIEYLPELSMAMSNLYAEPRREWINVKGGFNMNDFEVLDKLLRQQVELLAGKSKDCSIELLHQLSMAMSNLYAEYHQASMFRNHGQLEPVKGG